MPTYEAVIGLEIHVQLNVPTKLFCDCPNAPADRPNLHTCPTCLWMPGALPRLSQAALEQAAVTCLALHGELQPVSAFDQKVYYYPDLPKGYQLSQHHQPLSRNGWIEIPGLDGRPRRVRIHHVHMEEDVAKLVHAVEGHTRISLVDFNRAGVPLVEIVTEPDLHGPDEAMSFLNALRAQIRSAGTAECNMESGTMRCDANISLRPAGTDEINTKVEVKNMNSTRAVGGAIAYEITRQTEVLNQGRTVTQHTRLWDADKNVTLPMRSKFSGPCIPDPAVPPIHLSAQWIAGLRDRLPEMPAQRNERLIRQYGLSADAAATIAAERETGDYFEALVATHGVAAPIAAQWVALRLLPALKERSETPSGTAMTPARLAELLRRLEAGAVSARDAREIFGLLLTSDRTPAALIEQQAGRQIGDAAELANIVETVMAAHPSAVQDVRNGKAQAITFLVGQAMRASRGKAHPKRLRELFDQRIG